jgi:hypothetical protein
MTAPYLRFAARARLADLVRYEGAGPGGIADVDATTAGTIAAATPYVERR